MRSNSLQSNIEISGKPGLIWGNIIVPTAGRAKIRIKIVGDLLQSNIDSGYGLEKKDIQTRIQDIKSIEISSGPLAWLLVLGITTLFLYGLGIIFIILYFFIKQRWLIIYTSTLSIIVFYNKPEDVEQFRSTVLALARQINSPPAPRAQTSPPPPPRMPGQTIIQ
ncbi:hypothetical protein [Nostoc linckia]|uniref:hypothetical protein n=1 Tax=Nostoc linckia TaxID=92942 RepID=UPI000BFFB6E6|nr:hypothetical protein [Nostoc linckia]